jgi:hypothetical protein
LHLIHALGAAHRGAEVALERLFQRYQQIEVRPAQLSPQCGDNLRVGERFRELHHPTQVIFAEPLSIVATCIAHDVNPRAYLHKVVHCIVHGWPQDKPRDLLPDRMLATHPELYAGDPDALPIPS